ncbi:hypothetical protein COEREDRAFT_86533 [Coemansia reversa NRRL 1564]|uniref:Uncharacterized protein n=1 Tax=Coemansia reversa (strain ATCC 12441 / NRRL 1564) TaxID=763665 RepID=A0A2G5BDT2_COERN|nr:hypothetical protein COEREDRAFT_86533 [Coemansia reversa NRRL 1564]|eukprot:PIA17142.1 hypothetical protein COEREDRAFT_86533 [Coemansia reversa NRRL 1564]
MFNPTYRHVAAELSPEEEKDGIKILEASYRNHSTSQLLKILSEEFPLCLHSDLSELLYRFLRTKPTAVYPIPQKRPLDDDPANTAIVQQQSKNSFQIHNARNFPGIAPLVQNTKLPNYILETTNPLTKKKRIDDTEDPELNLSSKWTQEETDKLCSYLNEHQGRKNWISCARSVRTKSSAQCKAKFNNMRAQDLTRTTFDI